MKNAFLQIFVEAEFSIIDYIRSDAETWDLQKILKSFKVR